MVAVASAGRPEAIAEQLEAIVQKRLSNDKLVVPPMPVAAVKCLQLLKDPEYSGRKLVALLEQDPPLAARVLKLAQSAAMAGGGQIKSIEQAVTRVGAQRVRTMLLEASAFKVFESRDPRIAAAFKATWEHSVAVAIVARDLAAFSGKEAEADTSYLCGLLHDVGKPVLATLLLEAERLLVRSGAQGWLAAEAWIAAMNRGHRPIGIAVAEKWKLPEEIVVGIKDADDYDSVNRGATANYVRFANALAKREGLYPGPVVIDDVNALIMIGRSLLSIDDELISRVTTGLVDRVQQRSE